MNEIDAKLLNNEETNDTPPNTGENKDELYELEGNDEEILGEGRRRLTTLEKFFYGMIRPAEDIVPQNPRYHYLVKEIAKEREYFSSLLSDEDKERFEKLTELIYQCEEISEYTHYAYGFETGSSLIIDAFSVKGK